MKFLKTIPCLLITSALVGPAMSATKAATVKLPDNVVSGFQACGTPINSSELRTSEHDAALAYDFFITRAIKPNCDADMHRFTLVGKDYIRFLTYTINDKQISFKVTKPTNEGTSD